MHTLTLADDFRKNAAERELLVLLKEANSSSILLQDFLFFFNGLLFSTGGRSVKKSLQLVSLFNVTKNINNYIIPMP